MKKEVRIALLTLVTAVLAVLGFKFISGQNLVGGAKTFYTYIADAKGINSATKVLINGYQVGSVISVAPNPSNIEEMVLGFQVDKAFKIPKDTRVELRSESPIGGREISLEFDSYCEGNDCPQSGDFLKSINIGLLGSIITQDELNPHIDAITTSIDNTLGNLGDPASEAMIDKSVRDLSSTLSNLEKSTQRFALLMDKSSSNMEVTLANMAVLTNALVESNEKLSTILNNISTVSTDLAKVKLSETISKSNGMIDQASTSLQSLDKTMGDASTSLAEMQILLKKMNESEGSLGLLLNDKKLYNDLAGTNNNLNLLLQDLRLNPRRYFKVFGKKVPSYEVPEEDPASK